MRRIIYDGPARRPSIAETGRVDESHTAEPDTPPRSRATYMVTNMSANKLVNMSPGVLIPAG